MKRMRKKASFAVCSIIISIFLNLYLRSDSGSNYFVGGDDTIIRNYSNSRSEIYELNGDVRIYRISSKLLRISALSPNKTSSYHRTVKPYARRHSPIAMSKVEEMSIALHPRSDFYRIVPNCTRRFDVPAVVFSTGGYAHHPYHSVGDIVVPLYFTSRHFDGGVVFLISDFRSEWVSRYRSILERLSNYDVVDVDAEDRTLCFSKAIVGLDAGREEFMSGPKHFTDHSMTDFTRFIRNTHSLRRQSNAKKNSPRLLIISREKTRRLVNEGEVADLCKKVGFEVETKEITGDFEIIARYMNRSLISSQDSSYGS
ncbi:hypothetical protein M569_12563 [Genlisea aurea]|uniref:Uncharacterized protein n=1 Tax=Genlisea aurea TaxID=192259 RepID=S8C644_9LAMI|nr:hypothetical protein M569_12563 [Genlisea aurea]